MVQRICIILLLTFTLPTLSHAKKITKSPIPHGLDDLDCMALNLYHESRNEGSDVFIATTGFVTMQRVKRSAYPDSVCKVVYEQRLSNRTKKWVPMFSWTKDGKSDNPKNHKSYNRCLRIARKILDGSIKDITKRATHYHNTSVDPYWVGSMNLIAQIGNHVFYR